MTLCARRAVIQDKNQITVLERIFLFSQNGQPCAVKIIFFTPASLAARFPIPPILDELVWKTSGFSAHRVRKMKWKERNSSIKEISLFIPPISSTLIPFSLNLLT